MGTPYVYNKKKEVTPGNEKYIPKKFRKNAPVEMHTLQVPEARSAGKIMVMIDVSQLERVMAVLQ